MLEINKYSAQGQEVGKIELPAALFAAEAKTHVLYYMKLLRCIALISVKVHPV